jgi:hypothetical protein
MVSVLRWGFYVIYAVRSKTYTQHLWFLIPLAILMVPLPYLRFGVAGCGGQVKAVVLLFLLGVACHINHPCSIFGEDARVFAT